MSKAVWSLEAVHRRQEHWYLNKTIKSYTLCRIAIGADGTGGWLLRTTGMPMDVLNPGAPGRVTCPGCKDGL